MIQTTLLVIIYAHFFFFTHREDRYLLFITENYAALRILEHSLLGDLCEEKPLVLFGSRFPKDNELTKVIMILSVLSSHTVAIKNAVGAWDALQCSEPVAEYTLYWSTKVTCSLWTVYIPYSLYKAESQGDVCVVMWSCTKVTTLLIVKFE